MFSIDLVRNRHVHGNHRQRIVNDAYCGCGCTHNAPVEAISRATTLQLNEYIFQSIVSFLVASSSNLPHGNHISLSTQTQFNDQHKRENNDKHTIDTGKIFQLVFIIFEQYKMNLIFGFTLNIIKCAICSYRER